MVADTLIYHPTLNKLIRFLDSTPKREKAFRLVAYLSRFLSYYLQRTGYPRLVVQQFLDLKQHATFIRKGLRFLKPLNHLQTASKAYDNKLQDSVLQGTTVVRNLAYASYLSLDTITWFKMLGLAGVVNSLRTLRLNAARLASADEKTDAKAISDKIYQAKRKLVWDLLDSFICLNTLNFLHFTEGDVGFAGVITSIMGLRDLWAAT